MANPTTQPRELVLVTGGTGFLGAHCILACLLAGYRVRTTIRSESRKADIRDMLLASEELQATNIDLNGNILSFAVADLLKDAGWAEAVKDCAYVLHVASPFPLGAPKHEDDLIIPAREGTLRVLRAARDSRTVKRVVVTSSFAAIGYGVHPPSGKPFDETLWTDVNNSHVGAYHKSKTLAERAAWEFIEKEGHGLELSVVNPTGIFGPVLGKDFASSIVLVQRLLNGAIPGCPDLEFGIIDVRDVADLHLTAMKHPAAKGERFLAVATPCMTVQAISLALRDRMGEKAKKAPTRNLPNFMLRIIALWDPAVARLLPSLGERKVLTNEKAKRVLGWEPKWSNVDALVATGDSLRKFGLVKI